MIHGYTLRGPIIETDKESQTSNTYVNLLVIIGTTKDLHVLTKFHIVHSSNAISEN